MGKEQAIFHPETGNIRRPTEELALAHVVHEEKKKKRVVVENMDDFAAEEEARAEIRVRTLLKGLYRKARQAGG